MDKNCAICLKSLHKTSNKWKRLHLGKPSQKKKKKTTTLECFHTFHMECIKQWFRESTKCPLCRR